MGDPEMSGTPVEPSYDGLESRSFERDELSGLEDTQRARTNETVGRVLADVQEKYPWLSQSDYAIREGDGQYYAEFNQEAFTERAVEQVQEKAEEELPWLDDSDYAVRREGDQFTVDISESSYAEQLKEETGAERVEISKTEDGGMVATPFFGEQPSGRMETPGQGPDMRNPEGSDTIYNPTGKFETPGDGPNLWNPEENEVAYDQPEGRIETPGTGPDMENQGSDNLPSVKDRIAARVARQDEDLDPGDVTVTERSAENVTNLDIRADIAENPYQIEFSDDYKRDRLREYADELEGENPTLSLNVAENEEGEPTLQREEKYGDFVGEYLPGLENWVDEYEEENEHLLPGADWVESKAESADDFPLMLPTGQRVNVSGKKTTEGLASMYASVDLAELPKEAVEGAELVEHLVAPDQLAAGFGGEQQEASAEVRSRFSDVGEAAGFLRDKGVESAQKDPAGAIGKGTVLAGGIVVGSVAETAALRAATRGARGVSTPNLGVDVEAPSLNQYTPDVELTPDVDVVRSRDAPTVDVNVNTGIYRGIRQSGRGMIEGVESGFGSAAGAANYARFVAPKKAESVRETVSNLPENTAQSARRLARNIEDFKRQAEMEYAERAAQANEQLNRFLSDERSGSAPPTPMLRGPSGSGRFSGRLGDVRDTVVGRTNYARFVAPRKAANTREAIGNIPENAALSARRLRRDIPDYWEAVQSEAGFTVSEGSARAQQSFNRFLDDERSGSGPIGLELPGSGFSFGNDFRYSPSDVADAARGFGNYLDFRAEVAGSQASNRLASIPGELGQSVRRARREVSGIGAATFTRPLFNARNELDNYSLRVDVGKPRREQTPIFGENELDDVDVEFTGEVKTFDSDADSDVSNPGSLDVDVENQGDGGQTTVTRKRNRRDEPGQPEGIGEEFDMGGRFPASGAAAGAFGIDQSSGSVSDDMGGLFGQNESSGVDYNQGSLFDEESAVGREVGIGAGESPDFGVSERPKADFGYSPVDSADFGAKVDTDIYAAQDIDVAFRHSLAADTDLAGPAGGKRPWAPWPDDSDIDRHDVGGSGGQDDETWYNSIAKLGQY